ncbi:MAG: hypothetical protein RIR73_1280 [Chloroflexota bacterium]|jgi:hypothetical protein
MKRPYLYIAILALLLPALLRGLWFYRGFPAQRPEIATPDYASFVRPEAAVSTPDLDNIDQFGGTVVLDGYHGNQFALNEIDTLTSAIQARGGKMEIVIDALSLEAQLKTASAFITISPSLIFSQYETQLLKSFTERGGRVLVFTDATRFFLSYDFISGNPIAIGDANAANTLLKLWDISVNNDYLYNTVKNEGNFRNVLFNDFAKSELTFGLSEVALYGSRSVESASGQILLQGAETNLSSADDAHDPNAGGAAVSEDGNVVVFGDFTFLSAPYSTYTDNATLIQNLADFALSGERAVNLNNFPYLFQEKTVQVFVSPDLQKAPSLVAALGSLQSSMRLLNYKLEFVDEAPKSGDTIIIGTFDVTDEYDSYLKKADVEIDFDVINTTQFGEVSRSGNALVIFDANQKGNTLVLAANSSEDLLVLLSSLGYGSLGSCLTSDQVAVCSVGIDDFYSDESFSDPSQESPEGSTEPTPEVTPTPSG